MIEYSPIKLQFRGSDLELASLFTGMTKNHILYYVMLTAREIEGQYFGQITDFHGWRGDGYEKGKYFYRVRVLKPKDKKGKGLPLRYTMFYFNSELCVQVKTARSSYPKKTYTEKEIVDAYYTDEIEDMLAT